MAEEQAARMEAEEVKAMELDLATWEMLEAGTDQVVDSWVQGQQAVTLPKAVESLVPATAATAMAGAMDKVSKAPRSRPPRPVLVH